jgi:hypothetical protein
MLFEALNVRVAEIIKILCFLQAELLATCRTNLQCLQTILSHLKMSADEHALKPVRGMMIKLGPHYLCF